MPRPMGHIRILMSSRVLFDLEEADKIYREDGLDQYIDYMTAQGKYKKDYDPDVGGRRLKKGPLWSFAIAALKLNEASDEPVVEIGVSCKDQMNTALPLFRNLDIHGFPAEYRIATNGNDLTEEDHVAFDTDLLLTRNVNDAQAAVDLDIAASVINFPPNGEKYQRKESDKIRLWVDGDAVAFGSSAELVYRKSTLGSYKKHEFNEFKKSLEPGPFTKVLAKMSKLNAKFSGGKEPFEISLLTSRGGPAAARVCTIAQDFGIEFNGKAYFMGGAAKVNPLKAHKPDLFVDDQMTHLKKAAEFCPTGLVPYKTGSAMFNYMKKLEEKKGQAKATFTKSSDDKAAGKNKQKPDNSDTKPPSNGITGFRPGGLWL